MLKTLLLAVVVMAAYYVYYSYFGGKERAQKNHQENLGLWEGEATTVCFHAMYALEPSAGKDIALGLVGMKRVPENLLMGLTDRNRLVIGYQKNKTPPQGYEPGEVRVYPSDRKGRVKRLAGPKGSIEKTTQIVIESAQYGAVHYEMPCSAAEMVTQWANQAPAHTHQAHY